LASSACIATPSVAGVTEYEPLPLAMRAHSLMVHSVFENFPDDNLTTIKIQVIENCDKLTVIVIHVTDNQFY